MKNRTARKKAVFEISGHPEHGNRGGCPDPECWRHGGHLAPSTPGPNLTDLENLLGSLGLEPEWCNLGSLQRPAPDSPAGEKLVRLMDKLAGGLIGLGWTPPEGLGRNLAERDLDARLEGFADAEGLVLTMLADMAEKEWEKHDQAKMWAQQMDNQAGREHWNLTATRHDYRAHLLQEIELALRMEQHRTAEYGDPDLGRKLERAHQKMANSAGKGRRGGEKTSGGLTKDERVKKAKLAAEARWGKRHNTTTETEKETK